MDGAIFIALTNAAEGRDDDYNAWYSGPHFDDILAIDGVTAGQRFELADTPHAVGAPYRYLAVFEIEAGKTEPTVAAFAEAGKGGQIPLSDCMSDDRKIWWFTPITERREAPARDDH